MPLPFRRANMLAPLLLLAASAPPAAACAYDSPTPGVFGSGFEALHPKASVVYFAILDAVDQGVLERAAFAAIVPGPAGYWQAVGRINAVHRLLAAAGAGAPEPAGAAISLVFIESNLWARFAREAHGLGIAVHTPGARDGDVVVLTSEGAIAAVLDGRLPVAAALERGLVAIDGEARAAAATKDLILAALAAAPSPPPGTVGAREPPVRLFGPGR